MTGSSRQPEKLPPAGDATEPSPRAFAALVGKAYIALGAMLSLGSCCFWSFSGSLIDKTPVRMNHLADLFTPEHLPTGLALLVFLTAFVGGMGILAAGVGLNGELRRSGYLAMFASGWPTVAWIVCGVVLYRASAPVGLILLSAALAVFGIILFVLALLAAGVLAAYPPPQDQSVVRDDVLEQMKTRRRRERDDRNHDGSSKGL